jgi:hypothetical protein
MPPVWPTVTDDLGDKISGTIFNKLLTDAIKTYIDAYVVSVANPGVTPEDITDEVVAARGTKASLDARLDVALNEDGTPKPVAGQATTAQVGRQNNGNELARNRFMNRWSDGNAVAPDFYTLAGAGAAVARTGVGMGDATQIGAGQWAALVTSAPGVAAELQQLVIPSTELDDFTAIRGRTVNFMVRGLAAVGVFRLIVTDGINTTTGSYNLGGGSAEDMSVQHTIANTATFLQVSVEVKLGTNTAYLGAYSVTLGDVLPTRFELPGTGDYEGGFRAEGPRLVYRQLVNLASDTVLADSSITWPMPARTLESYGSYLELECSLGLANNAHNKSLRIYVGTNFFTPLIDNVALANNAATVRVRLMRISATQVVADGLVTFHAASGASPTVWHFSVLLAGGATDLTTAQDVKIEMVAPDADGDMTLARTVIVLWP